MPVSRVARKEKALVSSTGSARRKRPPPSRVGPLVSSGRPGEGSISVVASTTRVLGVKSSGAISGASEISTGAAVAGSPSDDDGAAHAAKGGGRRARPGCRRYG